MSDSPLPILAQVREREAQRIESGLRRQVRPRAADDDSLDLASNDYLGLTRDARVIGAAAAAASTWGAGATGSRLVTGSTDLHAQLERLLAEHVGAGAALVFSSGYTANLGAVTSLADKETLVVSDALNHASLIDAIKLSGARVVITAHRDADAVEAALSSRTEERALVVTDAIFSVDGDAAPLRDLHLLARQHGSTLVVDEAHSLGVIGPRGEGACATAGIAHEADVVQTLTLSKSLGSQGGAVAAHPEVIAHILDSARTFIFDTGLAPSAVGAALAALTVLREDDTRATAVRDRARDLRDAAIAAGWKATDPEGAVVSVLVGDPSAAVTAAACCAELGVRVGCFRPPSVPDGISRLRLTARATLTESDIDRARAALTAAASEYHAQGANR